MIFNTWMGDSLRGTVLTYILDIIKQEQLLDNTIKTGNYLYERLYEFQRQGFIQNLRGKDKGCFIAFDPIRTFPSVLLEDDLTTGKVRTLALELKHNGIITGTCGNNSIRLRPSLIFEKYHVDIFINTLQRILSKNL